MGFWSGLANNMQQRSMENDIERGMPGGRHLLRAIQQNGYDRQQLAQTHDAYNHAVQDAHATREWASDVANFAHAELGAAQQALHRAMYQLRCAEAAIAERDGVIGALQDRVDELEQELDSKNPLSSGFQSSDEEEVEEDPADAIARLRAELAQIQAD